MSWRFNALVLAASAASSLVAGPNFAHAQSGAPVRSADIRTAVKADGVKNVDAVRVEGARDLTVEEAWADKHELSLTSDNQVPGNLRVFDDAGNLVPAKVKLFFLREGQVATQAVPDENGDFQASGLTPGVYSLVAAGPSGFAAMGIRILPPPEPPTAPKANTIGRASEFAVRRQLRMNLSLIRPVDVRAAFQLALRENAGGIGSFSGLGNGLGNMGLGSGGALGAAVAAGGAGGGGAAAVGGLGLGGAGGLFATGAAGAAAFGAGNNSDDGGGTSASPNGSTVTTTTGT